MATRVRLDRELVRRGLAPSREAATAAIRDGRVLVERMDGLAFFGTLACLDARSGRVLWQYRFSKDW